MDPDPLESRSRLQALRHIYRLWDAAVRDTRTPPACRKGCSRCCTEHVTLTTLEGYCIADHLERRGRTSLLEALTAADAERGFQPGYTINQLADWCAARTEVPLEAAPAPAGSCPWLRDNVCPVYAVRPFGCRAMISEVDCRRSGCAETDPFLLTAATIFQQVIEDLDAGGGFGNFARVLRWMAAGENRDTYAAGVSPGGGPCLAPNRPLKVLMIPPEHRKRAAPLLQQLDLIRRGFR